jgi:hypothetical protein
MLSSNHQGKKTRFSSSSEMQEAIADKAHQLKKRTRIPPVRIPPKRIAKLP